MNSIPKTKVNRSRFSIKRLVPGEKILWEGRPSVIVYFLRSLLLTIFGFIFALSALLQEGKTITSDLGSYFFLLLMLVLIALMIIIHRKWGIAEGIVAMIVVVIVVFDVQITKAIFLAPAIIGLVALVVEYLVWSHTYFAISDRRIMTQTGIFSLLFVDTQIDRLQNVSVSQPFIERILGYGDVMFATAGEMGGIDSNAWTQKMSKGGAIVWENIQAVRGPQDRGDHNTPVEQASSATCPQAYSPASRPPPLFVLGEASERLEKLRR